MNFILSCLSSCNYENIDDYLYNLTKRVTYKNQPWNKNHCPKHANLRKKRYVKFECEFSKQFNSKQMPTNVNVRNSKHDK